MNVAFVIPPVMVGDQPAERSSGCTRVVYAMPNIYELTVAAVVRDSGHHVIYIDCINHCISFEKLKKIIAVEKIDVCCFWTVNLSRDNDIEVGHLLHEKFQEMPVVFMGPGATYFKDMFLHDKRNFVVRGEPEETMVALLAYLDNKSKNLGTLSDIAGLSFVDGEGIHNNAMRSLMKDLDGLPLPARDLVEGTEYRNPKVKVSPYTTMVTSRNCPFHCIYCVPSSLTFARELEYKSHYGRKPPIAYRSVEKIEEELKFLHEKGYKAIGFVDDNFIWTEKRTLAICSLLKQYDFVWGCQARIDVITETIAKALGESNCAYVDLGVESFNDDILKYIQKGITSKQIYKAIEILQKYKVPIKLNILIGTSPLETEETLKHTLKEARKLHIPQVMINIVAPFPGTKFYDIAKDNGWIVGGEYIPTDVQRNSILNYPHLSSKRMEQILYRSNMEFFLSPTVILYHLRRFKSVGDFLFALKALKNKLFTR